MSDAATSTVSPALLQAFHRALDLPEDVDVTQLAYGLHPQWDSLGHMVLVAELEEVFGLLLDTDDVLGLSDFDAAVALLARHGVTA